MLIKPSKTRLPHLFDLACACIETLYWGVPLCLHSELGLDYEFFKLFLVRIRCDNQDTLTRFKQFANELGTPRGTLRYMLPNATPTDMLLFELESSLLYTVARPSIYVNGDSKLNHLLWLIPLLIRWCGKRELDIDEERWKLCYLT